jgi:16S rRNA (cytosine1407-C5)-methyltransferase
MSWDKVDTWEYLILDTSASPWWKTTQLSEYYPNSIIIANEIDKTRLKWLFSNLDRMSSLNVVSTNYDGRFFKNIDEIFDKILIDAPCSWEWTSFKTDDSLKYRNIKNIKKIARLQFWLVESSIQSLKVWWELVYSTCTINTIENEEVIQKIIEKYGDYVEIVKLTPETNFKRNWPHRDQTWWFFVAKLRKTKSIENRQKQLSVRQNLEKLTNNEQSIIEKFYKNNFDYNLDDKYLYKYKSEIFLSNKNINYLWDKLFLYKIWINIWEIKDNEFIPSFYAWTFEKFEKWTIEVNEKQLNELYKWNEIENINLDENKYYQIVCNNMEAWICKIKDYKIRSTIPSKLIRK